MSTELQKTLVFIITFYFVQKLYTLEEVRITCGDFMLWVANNEITDTDPRRLATLYKCMGHTATGRPRVRKC